MQTGKLMLFSFLIIFPGASQAATRNFGPDGLKGLNTSQRQALSKGEIVLATKDSSKKALIEAAIVFDKTPQETWDLLSKTEDQPKYLDECKHIEVLSRTESDSREIHTVEVAYIDIVYGVLFKFQKHDNYFFWRLDPGQDNDLAGLEGFWRFYPYDGGKRTLARYGSRVSVKNVPSWIQALLKKRGVKQALLSVEKYVNSGGAYRK